VSTDDTTSETSKPFIANNLQSALARLNDPNIHRAFIIGGAYLYRETLKLAPATLIPPAASHLDPATDSTPYVDRILLTRVVAPEFEDCDVFMPEFRGPEFQGSLERAGKWVQASHAELREWVEVDVVEGVQEENGVKYEFQMWTRDATEQAD
jgi:dihydrofolate reductase